MIFARSGSCSGGRTDRAADRLLFPLYRRRGSHRPRYNWETATPSTRPVRCCVLVTSRWSVRRTVRARQRDAARDAFRDAHEPNALGPLRMPLRGPGRCAESARSPWRLCWGRRTAQSRARPRGVSRVYLGRASVARAGVAVRTQLVLRAPMKISGISRAYLAYAKGPDARHFGSSTFSPRSYASRVARSESTS